MSFVLGSKILLLTLSCFIPKQADLTFNEAKDQIVNQYKLHNAEKDLGIKTTNLEISENGFIRYRKTDSNNRSEYYSVKLSELKDACYLGDEKAGWLLLKFTAEAVIYQTYNDKAGNVDEMLAEISIPLKNINVDDINSLCSAINTLKQFDFKL
ncbi:hypothetical protein [Pedobacter arcticus]|uniref:hypothetical protein n=1 Tax=Pedobacter arcticus TaxID=752140 RepID=UPI00030A7BF0|nr:hypothetical protein [Pedobacter arcticus]